MEDKTELQQLRSKATELLLREDWNESINAYTHFISLCQTQISQTHHQPDLLKLHKSLCLSLSNRAEARFRLRDFDEALKDCEEALQIDTSHIKTLICKGKILLNLNRYSFALDCFKGVLALESHCNNGNLEMLNGLIEKCKKFDYLSRTGNFDVSNWVSDGYSGTYPELAEFVGSVEIKRSEISGRGLFSTKNLDVGSLILVTKAVATERCILPKSSNGELGEDAQLVMWKNFIEKINESAIKCLKTSHLISKLSIGEDEDDLEIPDISLFKPQTNAKTTPNETLNLDKILSVLDVNSLVENAVSSKILGKNRDYYGVGLWLLPCFINHSCSPNARRVHLGDHVLVIASREVKAGEEITFAYYDVLCPLSKRKEMEKTWGFQCECKRCRYEKEMQQTKPEMGEIEGGLERGVDVGCAIFRLEECMKRWVVRGREKGYFRASFWRAFSEAYESEKTVRRWGRKIPALEPVVESLVEAVGSDERVVKVLIRKLKKSNCGFEQMEKAIKLGRGVYGKIVKKQAMKILLELGVHD